MADSDERWLLHTMKGKIFHKRKLPIEVTLKEYLKALDNLIAQGAGPLPKKISFNSPQGKLKIFNLIKLKLHRSVRNFFAEFSLEMLEVLYRIYSAILKDEFNEHDDASNERFDTFMDVLDKVDAMNLFAVESKASKDDPAPSTEPEAVAEPPPEKKVKLDEPESCTSDPWMQISLRCQRAMVRKIEYKVKSQK
jgi:hypothetical protein